MKFNLFLTIFYLFSVLRCNSQSISDFISFRNSSMEETFYNLDEECWYIYDEDEQRKNDIIVYTFKQKDDIESMLGLQWINYVNRPRLIGKNRLSFQVQSLSLYEKYLQEIILLGFKLEKEKVFDNHIMYVYTNDSEKIEVITSQNKYLYDGMKYYNFAFYNAMEYDAIFLEENDKYAKINSNSNVNIATINFLK